jgi:hypothetical protein
LNRLLASVTRWAWWTDIAAGHLVRIRCKHVGQTSGCASGWRHQHRATPTAAARTRLPKYRCCPGRFHPQMFTTIAGVTQVNLSRKRAAHAGRARLCWCAHLQRGGSAAYMLRSGADGRRHKHRWYVTQDREIEHPDGVAARRQHLYTSPSSLIAANAGSAAAGRPVISIDTAISDVGMHGDWRRALRSIERLVRCTAPPAAARPARATAHAASWRPRKAAGKSARTHSRSAARRGPVTARQAAAPAHLSI